MKIIVECRVLAYASKLAASALPARPVQEVMEFVELKVLENGHMWVSGTDGTYTISKLTECEKVEGTGTVLLEGKRLVSMLSALSGETVSIDAPDGGKVATLKSGKSKYTVAVGVGQYPERKHLDDESVTSITVRGDVLCRNINTVKYAVDTTNVHPTLTGIEMEKVGDRLTMCGLDGYRVALSRTECESDGGDMKVNVPAKPCEHMAASALEMGEQNVTMQTDGKLFRYVDADTEITTVLLLDNRPDYRAVLPQSYTLSVSINPEQLLEVVKRADVVSRFAKNNVVMVKVTEGVIEVNARSETSDFTEQIECETQGNDIEIAFNTKYLIDALNACGAVNVNMTMTTGTSPAVIVPEDEERRERHLLMPVRYI